MAKGLFDLLDEIEAKGGDPEGEARARQAAIEADKEARAKEAQRATDHAAGLALLPTLAAEIKQGAPHVLALNTAVRCIGLLSDNPGWAEELGRALGEYDELMQETLFAESAALAEQRAGEIRTDYAQKVKRRLAAQQKTLERAQKELSTAIATMEAWSNLE